MRDMTQSVADAFPVQRPGTAEGGEAGDIGEGTWARLKQNEGPMPWGEALPRL